MTRASASPKVDRTIRLRDGRQMTYCEWGDLQGRSVALLHGMPGSRLFCPDEEATEAAGVRLLTMDRPGYGRSDPRPGRSLLDWADDYVELADQLGLPPSPVVGWSSGGPYALALGFSTPDRVTSIGLAASGGPIDRVPGAMDDISPDGRAAGELLAHDRAAGIAAFSKHFAWYAGDGWKTMFAESWGEADDRVIADHGTLEAMKEMLREGARQGSAGYASDAVAEDSVPWQFSLADIHQHVHVWWGESDVVVRREHADFLARSIPRASLVTFPGEGHLFPIRHWGEMLAALE
jgi:pimeloyl-ACP methyl ester carboxylesterase